jgi:N-acetylglucosaminyldiphosphoundecaprenol N-acetyl-beta-D-mannosaminyltransferase
MASVRLVDAAYGGRPPAVGGALVKTIAGNYPVRDILGVPIAATTLQGALDLIDETIAANGQIQIGVVNAAKIVNMQRDAMLRDDVLSSDVIFADGISVVWAGRLLGRPLPERVAGIDLMHGMLERGRHRGYRVFCLGATDEVLERTVAQIAIDYPGVQVVGYQNGYFSNADEPKVAAAIAASRANILLVAMTSPKKENFLGTWGKGLGVNVCHGVGGSFDVMAGKVRRAPAVWQRLGLEWLYRVKQEPGRLWRRYLVTNTLFIMAVAREMLSPSPLAKSDVVRHSGVPRR